ncbi:hypothetical protein NUM3379_10280 [Kineococcus sp. NUM-3379]
MTSTADDLRRAFTAAEELAPDTTSVLAGIERTVVRHRRRRRLARAAGGATLAAGVGAAFLLSTNGAFGTDRQRVQPAITSAPAPVPTAYDQRAVDAFFAEGYTYADALKLAELWNSADAAEAKSVGGQKLLRGMALPVAPGSTPEDYGQTPDQKAMNAFWDSGYDYDDAVALQELWQLPQPVDAKVKAGGVLLAGGTLPDVAQPAAPGSDPGDGSTDPAVGRAIDAFFDEGYTSADAHHLAALWVGEVPSRAGNLLSDVKVAAGEKLLADTALPVRPGRPEDAEGLPAGALQAWAESEHTYDDAVALDEAWNVGYVPSVKAIAGLKLLAGVDLPVEPGSSPAAPVDDQRALDAFFEKGYDWDDAVELAALWNLQDPSDAKVKAGRMILDGATPPVPPGGAPAGSAPYLEGDPTPEELGQVPAPLLEGDPTPEELGEVPGTGTPAPGKR